MKLPSGRIAVFGSVLSGVVVGAAFGLSAGWVAIQYALWGVWRLHRSTTNPKNATGVTVALTRMFHQGRSFAAVLSVRSSVIRPIHFGFGKTAQHAPHPFGGRLASQAFAPRVSTMGLAPCESIHPAKRRGAGCLGEISGLTLQQLIGQRERAVTRTRCKLRELFTGAARRLVCTVCASTPNVSSDQRLGGQSGQIMMPAIVMLLISAGLFYLMVNSSQAVNEKTRVTNAADAAAYSAGVVEARALNYHAYTNRAMVANQVVIAQMVSFASWIRYFGTAIDQLPGSATQLLFMLQPDLDAFRLQATFTATDALLTSGGLSGQALADFVLNAASAGVTLNDVAVHQFLARSQQAVQITMSLAGSPFGIAQQQAAADVVRAMDPGLNAVVVPTSHGFGNFTRAYARDGGRGDERGRFADVTSRSRDEFTRDRSWTIDAPGGFVFRFIRRDAALKKRGGTDLVSFDEWRAMDTLELHGRTRRRGLFGRWRRDIQLPIGWGAVNVNTGNGDAGPGFHGNAYGENRRTAGVADSQMVEPPAYAFHGLPPSYELSNLDPNANRTTGITIAVTKRHASLLTSGGSAQARPSGQLALFDARPAGGRMMAMARAEVFFDRLDTRAGNRVEIGSLYNPYWRVRLIPVAASDRVFAAVQQGGLALP